MLDLLSYATRAAAAYDAETPADAKSISLVANDGRLLVYGGDGAAKITIACRGTANVENIVDDVKFKPVMDTDLGIYFHRGFREVGVEAYDDVIGKLPPPSAGLTVDVTGHSLGGAVAVYLAMRLAKDGYNIGHTVTFGQPRVTRADHLKRYLDKINLVRVVHRSDTVPKLPPLTPIVAIVSLLAMGALYGHGGELEHLRKEEADAALKLAKLQLKAETSWLQRIVKFFTLAYEFTGDHPVKEYLSALRASAGPR